MSLIAIGSDHAAFEMKEIIRSYLNDQGHEVKDFGTFSKASVDYCDYGVTVAEAVTRGEYEKGIVFCGTGVGIAISANKVKGIRAVVCSEPYSAKMSRAHNDTNILALGSRVIGIEMAKMIIDIWLITDFEGGRHAARIEKISNYEKKH